MHRNGLFTDKKENSSIMLSHDYFNLLDKSESELKALAKKGKIGCHHRGGDLIPAQDVLAGKRPISYIENGVIDEEEALAFVHHCPELITRKIHTFPRFTFVFRKDNVSDALQRIHDLELCDGKAGFQYLHGMILGYKSEDVARFMFRDDDCKSFGERVYKEALSARKLYQHQPQSDAALANEIDQSHYHVLRNGQMYMM